MIPNPGEKAVCPVTGANRGIGREVCRQLARRGHTVVLTARSADAAATAAREAGAEPLRLDVTDPASVADAARWVGERYGKLDVLVNNAVLSPKARRAWSGRRHCLTTAPPAVSSATAGLSRGKRGAFKSPGKAQPDRGLAGGAI
jgi:NAD(P)-dependent dehydrogenase (short-subunit alcohol dehydrogenase family)